MRPDFYTKAVLTVIAVALIAIACNQYIEPKTTVQAQSGPFAGVQAVVGSCSFALFDPRSGTVSSYDMCPPSHPKGNFTAEMIRKITLHPIEKP